MQRGLDSHTQRSIASVKTCRCKKMTETQTPITIGGPCCGDSPQQDRKTCCCCTCFRDQVGDNTYFSSCPWGASTHRAQRLTSVRDNLTQSAVPTCANFPAVGDPDLQVFYISPLRPAANAKKTLVERRNKLMFEVDAGPLTYSILGREAVCLLVVAEKTSPGWYQSGPNGITNRLLPTLLFFACNFHPHKTAHRPLERGRHPSCRVSLRTSCLVLPHPLPTKRRAMTKREDNRVAFLTSCVPVAPMNLIQTHWSTYKSQVQDVQVSWFVLGPRVVLSLGSRVSYYYADESTRSVCSHTAAMKKINVWTNVGA